MPFIKKELGEYKTCKGAALLRSKEILNTLSKRGEARKKINLKDQELQSSNSQVWDHVHWQVIQILTQDRRGFLSCSPQIWDHVHGQKVSCQSSCTDQTNMVLTTQAQYPARWFQIHLNPLWLLQADLLDKQWVLHADGEVCRPVQEPGEGHLPVREWPHSCKISIY